MFPIEHAKAIGIVAYRRTSRNNHAACGTADAVPAAKERVARSTVKTRDWAGAARKKVRSVEELREVVGGHH